MTVRPRTSANGQHARIIALLAIYGELTDAQIERRYQTRAVRAANPWPFVASSSLRTRRDELTEWGEVVEISRDGRSPSQRRMRVWGLNPVPRLLADDHGEPVGPSAKLPAILDSLELELDDIVVRQALAEFAKRIGLVR